jgi:nitrate/nitrite-specific signal transduction histidine kinase
VAFAPGETLRYQYMLEGGGSGWSEPSPQHTVNYANLSSGSYRFVVRALNAEGLTSVRPASIEFVILPPLWLRWWFQLIVAALAGVLVYAFYRYRVTRLVELERVRTRIATDLHDDIGSSLSQIAILSEVAKRQLVPAAPALAEPLADIAGISRDVVDSMSDIIWAIDPERDHLGDLVNRMRRFSNDVLSVRDIQVAFVAPQSELAIGADLRRQIFLIFKEAVHNIVRHSGATEVRIALHVDHGWLTLEVQDNGAGFNSSRSRDGRGLRSMRERARSAGGTADLITGCGGTTVRVRLPLDRHLSEPAPDPHK